MIRKSVPVLALVLCLCLCAGLCAAESDHPVVECEGIAGPYQWMGYELTVKSVRYDSDGGKVEVCLYGDENGIPTSELTKENLLLFKMTDASGQVVPPVSFSWWGVTFDAKTGTFGDAKTQEGFILIYALPEGVSPEDLVLTV